MTPLPLRAALVAAALTAFLAVAGPASANVPVTQISSDPFTNTTSQHATEVEPDTFASSSTVVAAFQVGRFFNGGATDIGWSRWGAGGRRWTQGYLPGMTATSGLGGARGASFERVSDASVPYDRRHATWL